MNDITENEMKVMLRLFRDINTWYNANNLAKQMGISAMGVLKIVRRLKKENILKYRQEGRRKYYYINYDNQYAKDYLNFLLKKEAEESIPRVKVWMRELNHFNNLIDIGIIFGSVIRNDKYNDVDIVMVYNEKDNKKVMDLVKERNILTTKKIHPIRQTINDLKKNIKKGDKVILNALKSGIVGIGHEKFVEVMEHVTYRQ